MSAPNSAGDYDIISVLVHSHKHEKPINIASHVSEIEIYENIELAYLTGTFNMKDDLSMYDGFSWNGTEMIDISFESPENVGNIISKRFTIAKIIDTAKSSENIEAVEIKIVETNCFNNQMQKINKCYTGTPEQIIKNILKDNLDMDMNDADMPGVKCYQKTMKFIVPNLSPLQACEIIRSRMSTDLGLPYFLYATLNTRNVQLKSLDEMLRTPSINKTAPYRYSQVYNQSTTSIQSDENVINVSDYSSTDKQSSIRLMATGATAGQHSVTDMTTGQTLEYTFDVEDLFENMIADQLITKDTTPVHHSKYKFKGKLMNEYNTFNRHKAVGNGTYNGVNNIHQEENAGAFRLAACNNALRHMMFKTSMSIRVPGRLYLIGSNASLGRQIDFIYPSNQTIQEGSSNVSAAELEDKKRSGVFIIYTARHHFNEQQHNVDMSCVKLGNRK